MLYKAYHHEIVGNVIAYIAKRYHEHNGYNIYQMPMYKILALFDFQCVKKLGSPCLELDFRARRMGPVPEELYNNKQFEDSFTEFKTIRSMTQDGQQRKPNECTCTPDLDYLSTDEQNILEESINRLIDCDAKEASEISHKFVKAWSAAFNRTPNSQMLYAEEFDRNIYLVDSSELTLPEYTLIQYNVFANA